jgi:hypothetical protein
MEKGDGNPTKREKHTERGFGELPTNTKLGGERNEIEYMRGNAGFVFNHTDASL